LHTQVSNGKTNSSSQHGPHHRHEDQPPAYRRWPSGNPRLSAFCRSAPAVRFMALAICFTGDFLRECALNSRTSALDQARRLTRLARLLAICPSSAAAAAMRPSIAERMRDEKQPTPPQEARSMPASLAVICTRAAIAPLRARPIGASKSPSVAYSIRHPALYQKSHSAIIASKACASRASPTTKSSAELGRWRVPQIHTTEIEPWPQLALNSSRGTPCRIPESIGSCTIPSMHRSMK
jgi:hypothetical protein